MLVFVRPAGGRKVATNTGTFCIRYIIQCTTTKLDILRGDIEDVERGAELSFSSPL